MLLVISRSSWSWSITSDRVVLMLLWYFSFLEGMSAKHGYHLLIHLANKHWNWAWIYPDWITIKMRWALTTRTLALYSTFQLGQNGRKCGAGDTLDPSFGWFLVRAGTSHVAFLVACALGGVAAMPSRKTIVGWCRCGRDVIALWEEGERHVACRPNISHHSSNENALK